uniref:Uncharacterized protein n=1 Tax=Oryza glumipatula TaxID=40148 RepID=A0A0E0AQT2_9ORYZ
MLQESDPTPVTVVELDFATSVQKEGNFSHWSRKKKGERMDSSSRYAVVKRLLLLPAISISGLANNRCIM